jgi:hypothetical protein
MHAAHEFSSSPLQRMFDPRAHLTVDLVFCAARGLCWSVRFRCTSKAKVHSMQALSLCESMLQPNAATHVMQK